MSGVLRQGKTILGIGLFALLVVAAVGATSASADVRPFEVTEYGQDLGVPTHEAEESLEVQQSGAEADISGDLEEQLGSRYAGIWFDNASGEFVVPLLPLANGAVVDNEFAQADLGGADFRFADADSSWQALEAAQDEIDGALTGLREEQLVRTSLDPRANAVVVELADAADAAERDAVQDIASGAGVAVDVRQASTQRFHFQLAACVPAPIAHCDAPMRGGVIIQPDGTPLVGAGCTAGFKAIGKTNGRRYVLTAGHCVPASKEWESFLATGTQFNEAPEKYLGTVAAASFPVHDYAAIDATGTFWDTSPWPSEVAYWGVVNAKGESTPTVDAALAITGESSSFVGEYVCHSGQQSGTTCGIVTQMGIAAAEEGTNETIYNLTKFSPICSTQGDSGGPVFAGNIAIGLFSGDEPIPGETGACREAGFYTEITEDTDGLNVTVGPRVHATQTTDEAIPLNGNPGWVTVRGQVVSGTTVDSKYVNLNMRKWENNEWVTKATLNPTVTNGHFEVVNWNGVSPGKWVARAVFPAQGGYAESFTDASKEGLFEVKAGYRVVNKKSGKCLNVIGRSFDNTAQMQQWECLDPMTAQGQVFTLVPQGEYVQLVVRNSGRCVDVPGASQLDGTILQQYTCLGAGQANQLWKVVGVETVGGVEYVELRAKHSSKCMDVVGGSSANGIGVQQWTCNGGGQQKWSFQSVESGSIQTETTAQVPAGSILNGQPGYVSVNGVVKSNAYALAGKSLNVNFVREESPGNWKTISTAHPTLDAAGNYEVSNWGVSVGTWKVRTVFPNGGGFGESVSEYQNFQIKSGYRFVYRHSSKCMSLSGNNAANTTPIVQWDCSPSPSPADGQVFTLVPMGGAYFEVKINSTEKCVDVAGASTANGAGLQEYTCLGPNQANQLWQVIPISGQPGWNALVAKHSNKCADVAGSSTANGASFIQYECSWGANEQFAFQAIN